MWLRYSDHSQLVLGLLIPPPPAQPVLLAQPSHDPPTTGTDVQAVDEAGQLDLVDLLDAPEVLPNTPDPQPAVPGAGDDEVGVLQGGHGGHPVRVLVTRIGAVALLHLTDIKIFYMMLKLTNVNM